MDTHFWIHRWENNEIGFHQEQENPWLVKHFNTLPLKKDSRVFIPLCGKTRDIAWLLSNGYRVAGAELSTTAIEQLFADLDMVPLISVTGDRAHYGAENIDIFVGDIFHLSGEMLGPIDAVYDRAALVALPKAMRTRYAAHLIRITDKAPQLLLSFEYDQSRMDGPPFSVDSEEVQQHYQDHYDLTLLASTQIPGGLKGICPAKENVWLLLNRI